MKRFLKDQDYEKAKEVSQYVYGEAQTKERVKLLQSEISNLLSTKWYTERQAVYNLLYFPALIPEDLQLKYILKGTDDLPFYPVFFNSFGLPRLD